MDESELQRKASALVDREVYCCVSWMLKMILQVGCGYLDPDDLDLPFDEADVTEALAQLRSAEIEVPLDLREKYGEWYTVDASREDEIREEWEEAQEAAEARISEFEDEIEDVEDGDSFDVLQALQAELEAAQAERDAYDDLLAELDDIEYEEREVYEVWIVSGWLANQLRDQGEAVVHGNFWLRCTTGQAVSMDGVIRMITKGMHE